MEVLNNYFVGSSSETSTDVFSAYLDDKFNGYGKVLFHSETSVSTYNGPISNGKMSGKGVSLYMKNENNYKKYEGNYLDGKFNGHGKLLYLDGNQFVGQFKNGLKHGPGKMYNPNGDVIMDNIWKNDCVCGKVNYVEYFHQTTVPKVVGTMTNSVKTGPWIYYKLSSNKSLLVDRIDYYEDYNLDSVDANTDSETSKSDKEIKEMLLKTLSTSPCGRINDQLIIQNKTLSLEEILMLSFDYCINPLEHNVKSNKDSNLDKGLVGSFDPAEYEKYATPTDTKLIDDNTLVLRLNNNNIVSIDKYLNGERHEYVVFLEKDNNKKNVSKYVVNNIERKTKSIYEINPDSDMPLPTIHYEGEMINNQPHGKGTTYECGMVLYDGVFDHGQIIKGTYYNTKTSKPIYQGTFKNSLADGEGKFYDDNGYLIYDGFIKNGKREGNGISYWANSTNPGTYMNWEGGWSKDMKHGKGRLYGEDGVIICICSHVNDNFDQVLNNL
jgi:hypothetical protein